MGKIRVVSAVTNSMEDVSQDLRRDPRFRGDRPLSAAGHEERNEDTIVGFDQAPDSSRSRGYGRYEI